MKELEPRTSVPEVHETVSEPDKDASAASTKQSGRGALREIVETVVLTIVIFAVVNTVTGRFRIEGPSMMPNLVNGQYIIINKLTYKLQSPQRGDIVVFHHPRNTNRDLIKRIIGLPGESIEVRLGSVYIDGNLLEEPYVHNHARYSIVSHLGPDEYFVLGDNRPNSDDSHNWGTLSEDNIVGKAWISYWPPSEWGGVAHYGYASAVAAREPAAKMGTLGE